jgi:hypothetical protein
MPLPDPATEVTEQAAATARDQFVVAVWTGTLPRTLEDEMRSELTPVGNFYDDLLSLDNQYFTALTVLREAGLFVKSAAGAELDDNAKRTVIMIARSMVTNTEPDPEATL